jgi:cyclase
MLIPRVIPCLLVHNRGLVKTVRFSEPRYVGDPINAVRIFNEKEVDELIVIDIDATVQGKEPDYKMIENLAAECRMPLCYGGGIKTTDQAARIFSLGAEKIAISSAAIDNPSLISSVARQVGKQSVVIVLDAKKDKIPGSYVLMTHNGTINTGIDPVEFAKKAEELGAGEIVINSIDNDGMMKGYDHTLISKVKSVLHIPVTVLGGAGSLSDMQKVIADFGIIGAAAGSLFVFKGKFRAVLINYPSGSEKELLFKESSAS